MNGHGGLTPKVNVAAGATGTGKAGLASRDQTSAMTTAAVVCNVPAKQGGLDVLKNEKRRLLGLQQAPRRKRRKLEATNIAERPNLRRNDCLH